VETTEQVANPPQPTTTTPASSEATSELERHSSFLGVRPAIEVIAEDPETSAATETDGTDGQTEAAPASAEGDEQDDPNWLPDEQQKVFTDDAIARYAKRYGYTQEQIEQNPQLRQLLHDKINSDIFLAKMRDGQSDEGEGPTLEGDEAEAVAPQTQTDPAEQRKQYYSQVENIVNQTCDPVAFNELGMNVLQALSVDVNDPEMKAVVEKAPQVGKVLATGAVDLMLTTMR